MRKSTTIITSIVAASALAISLRVGDISTQDNIPIDFSDPNATATPSPSGTPSESSSPSPSAPTNPTKPPAPIPTAAEVTMDSDVIDYKYGVVQISITKVGNQITGVEVLQGDATNGRDEAYAILIDATLLVQGTNFGNVSGATFTTDAFRKAVDNALLKF